MVVLCLVCDTPFSTKPVHIRNGKGKYCCRPCEVRSRKLFRTRPIADRFWEKVDKSGDCWLWTGSKDKNGYGRIMVSNEEGPMLASRLSWKLAHNDLPAELDVCHKCDNPSCVRPDHLFLGTAKANMQDCSDKGRTTTGERGSAAKLTAEQVRDIRRRYAEGGISQQQLADEYGLAQATIGEAIRRITWHHLS